MSELIEKQKVLDALREIATEKFSLDDPYGVYINVLMDVEEKICRLPVVQPNGPDNLVKDSQGLAKELVNDTISRQEAIDAINGVLVEDDACKVWFRLALQNLPSAQPEQRWIPCSERLPEINQAVLLSTTDGEVIVGYRYRPDIVWQVTANDGRKIWVYDPENYPGNIDELPKAETCGFENRDNCWLSVTSINYELKFAGISAWMPLPEPYKEDGHD